ncbi:MAG: hypothetical protein A3C93_02520 [Candidatus Lloydbacteria bacterium RIFCSPHIGHO2_02_FULL_54_17]|uniref:SpoVT-AbrB domain-containing protein n=1 Tax=Candidatus Lloydbacteria bacterium RIFCSPHIGHO2_02_FULL_54_17 TaxID=1798664 RepID=A0A1G2DDR7_9BACT|nr:MAG: hypothetical protein A2762_04380 [Candidatus Lloydbacteria bacterium RIFCSPHIGHO2_01_FULL_54_11]OGZ11784.1 MAG: hypothetical protein A3C93_02520 [Candidatus Lloydbacteria bacterium RIFCSPHIGHO2_02_FULL_54_17]OGZ14313.1 MAG: hypothetical protein A2948_01855 [Candidatus Lloydbacteria bacterium RIFCSPLOWO2_01_FULL_54_18]OGZ16019.1 MAG: hypothetical protein A3H76_00625 [Candidatus Lloydbacteria bacterium RIFCSPLOWO2_02_FULL_54_12]
MTTKVQKWGNSLAVRIPKEVAGEFRSGTSVTIGREGDTLLVRLAKKQNYSLKELVARIDTKKLHKESDWGGPRGRETW